MERSDSGSDLPLSNALSEFLVNQGPDTVTQPLIHEGLEFQVGWGASEYQCRIPKNRNTTPEANQDGRVHDFRTVGVTGWNWRDEQTEFVIIDYDAYDHENGNEEATLELVKAAAASLGWVWVRHSKGGRGYHLVVVLDTPMPAATGTAHQANAKAVLERMSADSGFDFGKFKDCCGVVGYVYPAKGENAFKVLVNPNSKAPVIEVQSHTPAGFEELTSHTPCDLSKQHEADIAAMHKAGWIAAWDTTAKRLSCHSKGFELLKRTGYRSLSAGTNKQEPNSFAYATSDGGWVISRFSVAAEAEADCWYRNKEGFASAKIEPPPESKKDKGDPKINLFKLAKRHTLCCTPERVPVVVGQFNGKRRTFILPDKELEGILSTQLLGTTSVIPTSGQLKDAMRVVEATAIQSEPRSIYTRVGPHNGNLYVDLGDETQRAIQITGDGWSVIDNPPVLFHRSPNITSLPEPVAGGQLDEMLEFLNVHPDQWPVIVAFILGAWNPSGDYPILFLHGQAESGKSTIARHIQAIVDPHWDENSQREDLFAPPKNEEDLMITALHTRLIGYDNLTTIGKWLHPALCRLSTGGASIARKLYTNSGMVKMSATRPVMITAVHDIMDKSEFQDLRSRALIIPCVKPAEGSKPPKWSEFEALRPRILGSVCEAVSMALHNYSATDPLPGSRLPDFTRFALAAEPATGLQTGSIAAALQSNRVESAKEVLCDPVAVGVRELAEEGFHGTAGEVLRALQAKSISGVPEGTSHGAVTTMGRLLTNMATEQAKVGVRMQKGKDRQWDIGLHPSAPSCDLSA